MDVSLGTCQCRAPERVWAPSGSRKLTGGVFWTRMCNIGIKEYDQICSIWFSFKDGPILTNSIPPSTFSIWDLSRNIQRLENKSVFCREFTPGHSLMRSVEPVIIMCAVHLATYKLCVSCRRHFFAGASPSKTNLKSPRLHRTSELTVTSEFTVPDQKLTPKRYRSRDVLPAHGPP